MCFDLIFMAYGNKQATSFAVIFKNRTFIEMWAESSDVSVSFVAEIQFISCKVITVRCVYKAKLKWNFVEEASICWASTNCEHFLVGHCDIWRWRNHIHKSYWIRRNWCVFSVDFMNILITVANFNWFFFFDFVCIYYCVRESLEFVPLPWFQINTFDSKYSYYSHIC